MLQGLVLRLCNVFHISFKSTNDECIYITLIIVMIITLFNNYRRTLTIMEETHERII